MSVEVWNFMGSAEHWQHLLIMHLRTLLCDFMWSSTSWLGCFHFPIIPLTVQCGINPITVPCLNSLSSSEWPCFFPQKMFVIADCMARCLILNICGNGSDWNTWTQFRGTSQYFCLCSIVVLSKDNTTLLGYRVPGSTRFLLRDLKAAQMHSLHKSTETCRHQKEEMHQTNKTL